MNSAFDSWSDFWAMGGYATYVWLAVSITLLSMLSLVLHTCWQRRYLLREVQRHQARHTRRQQAVSSQQAQANGVLSSAEGES